MVLLNNLSQLFSPVKFICRKQTARLVKAGDNYSRCPVQCPRLAKTYALHDCWVSNLEDRGGAMQGSVFSKV